MPGDSSGAGYPYFLPLHVDWPVLTTSLTGTEQVLVLEVAEIAEYFGR